MNFSAQPPQDPMDSPPAQGKRKAQFDLAKIPGKYRALAIMVLWGTTVLLFGMVRLDTYGMDEGGAMALLLAWSVAENVVIAVTVLGGPDFRALFFWPVAMYWPGSMLAAKIFTMMVMFGGALALYRWSRDTHSEEAALIATGLLLIAPLTILQIDSVASAPFLLGAFGLGLWLDKKYRASPHTFGSLYFLQLLLAAATLTLHPMGAAYPLALAWRWHVNSEPHARKKPLWLGLAIAGGVILVMQLGWIDIRWLANPLTALNAALFSVNEINPGSGGWIGGALLCIALLIVLARDHRALTNDLMGSMLLAAVLVGISCADHNWALLASALLLYRGFPLLIELNKKVSGTGFLGQRGLVFVAIMTLAVLFMRGDKSHAQFITAEILSPVDELIRTLSNEAADPNQPFLAASQWPARTMLVCRRDVLHLPPPQPSGEQLLKSIKGVTHIVFDHRSPANDALNRNLSEVSGSTLTLAIQQAGVLIRIKAGESEDATPHGQTPEPAAPHLSN